MLAWLSHVSHVKIYSFSNVSEKQTQYQTSLNRLHRDAGLTKTKNQRNYFKDFSDTHSGCTIFLRWLTLPFKLKLE